MDLSTTFQVAKRDILNTFKKHSTKVFSLADLRSIVNENRQFWRLPETSTIDDFISLLLEQSPLKEVRLEFPYRSKLRFVWGNVKLFELLMSLDPNAYFCHYSAVQLHGLTEQIPKTIYLNLEQKMRGGGGQLTQERVDRAFKGRCRTSSNFVDFADRRIYMLNGGNTDKLGVIEIESDLSDGKLQVTDIERTLIDATVRPIYSGGVHEVAEAFHHAHDRVSVNKLVSYLRRLNYTYPYHQAIGFYMERTGVYRDSQLALLHKLDMEFDFYLTYQMKNPAYNKKWKLWVPEGFQ